MAKEYAIEVQAKAYCELYSGILQDNLPLEEDMRTKAGRLNQQGEDLFKKGDLEGALNAFTRAIEIHPNFATAHNNLGVLYYNQGEKDKALNQYQQGVQLQPENNTFQKNLADFYYVEQGRVEEAMQIYVKILNANPEDIEILLVLANICINLEKFDDAKYFYNRILNIEPGNKDAKGFLEKLEKCQLSDAGGRLDQENNGNKTPDMQIHQAAKGGDQDRNRFVPEWKLVYERYHKLPGSTPLVSVIIPCYNYGKYLREAVESVIIQTFQDFEIIIINDGSTDNSKDVAEQLIKVYSEHRILC